MWGGGWLQGQRGVASISRRDVVSAARKLYFRSGGPGEHGPLYASSR